MTDLLVGPLMAAVALFVILAVTWLFDRHQVRRRRRRDLAFLLHVGDAMRRHAAIRPKSAPTIQRRRYAR